MPTKITVLLYQNRANPSWMLTKNQSDTFDKYFSETISTTKLPEDREKPPKCGYAGFLVEKEDTTSKHTFSIFKQIVIHATGENNIALVDNFNIDKNRNIESLLINSAPPQIKQHLTCF